MIFKTIDEMLWIRGELNIRVKDKTVYSGAKPDIQEKIPKPTCIIAPQSY